MPSWKGVLVGLRWKQIFVFILYSSIQFESFPVRLQLYITHVIYLHDKIFRCHNDLFWKLSPLKNNHFILIYRHTLFYCVLVYCHFLQIEDIKQVYRCYFSNSICSLHVSVSHLVILIIFQTFSLLLYLLWWSVICDVTIVIVLGVPQIMLI